MSFLDISSLLGRYEEIFSSQARKKKVVIDTISACVGVVLKETQVTIDGDRVLISAPHPVKNEIFLQKEKILDGLRDAQIYRIN
jgi:hypothetical protein